MPDKHDHKHNKQAHNHGQEHGRHKGKPARHSIPQTEQPDEAAASKEDKA